MKKLAAVVLALLMICSYGGVWAQSTETLPPQPPKALQAPQLALPCRNAILVSGDTGEVLYEQLPDDRVSIASITKVMTLLLTFEAIEKGKVSLHDTVPVSEHAYSMGGSQIWIEPGEVFTLEEMIKAICISSANDAAVAVAEYVGGSEPVFAEMMNARAAELGMTNTHFINACGLDEEGHYSSARDVAIMSVELLKHTQVLEFCGTWTDSLRGGQTQLVNTNKLLKTYAGTIGLKTGTTGKAGVCISACAQRDGTTMLAVVLGSASSQERFEAAKMLLDYGFSTYEAVDFPLPQPFPAAVSVRHGTQREVPLCYEVPTKLLIPKGEKEQISSSVQLNEDLQAPVQKGAPVGVITVQRGEGRQTQYKIYAAQEVPRMDWQAGFELLCDGLRRL